MTNKETSDLFLMIADTIKDDDTAETIRVWLRRAARDLYTPEDQEKDKTLKCLACGGRREPGEPWCQFCLEKIQRTIRERRSVEDHIDDLPHPLEKMGPEQH